MKENNKTERKSGNGVIDIEKQSIQYALSNPEVRKYAAGMWRMARAYQEIRKNPRLVNVRQSSLS